MSTAADDGFQRLLRYAEDPEVLARLTMILRDLLDSVPGLREKLQKQLVEEAIELDRRSGWRDRVRRVLALRELALSPEQDARIEACADLATLRRWHEQAVVAASTAEALR
jgi:hypothetical protein